MEIFHAHLVWYHQTQSNGYKVIQSITDRLEAADLNFLCSSVYANGDIKYDYSQLHLSEINHNERELGK